MDGAVHSKSVTCQRTPRSTSHSY